jgi:LacI family transcriptional regulator, galactose operon repressor
VTVSIKQVANAAGVSLGTVSNVLNRPDQVAPETRQRVQAVIAKLGYVRNDSARQLRAGRSRTIAVVVLDVGNPFFTDVVRGAELQAGKDGVMVIVCNSGDDPARQRRHLEQLAEQRVRGVLITPVESDPDAALSLLAMQSVPAVLVDRASGQPDRCSVAVDDVLGGRLAAQHLLAQGHQHIAFLGGPPHLAQVADRYAGAAGAVAHVPHARLTAVETDALTVAAGNVAAQQILAKPDRPTALFCANDLIALGALQALTQAAIAVPGDMAIVGYDDIEYAAAAAVPLSSVRQPRELLGQTAAQLLSEETDNPQAHRHRHVKFLPELVVRRSSTPQDRRTG